jgi:hypothetical protein
LSKNGVNPYKLLCSKYLNPILWRWDFQGNVAIPLLFFCEKIRAKIKGGIEEMKVRRSKYKNDKLYPKVVSAVTQIFDETPENNYRVAMPYLVFIKMGYLTQKHYEDWRFGRVPYLEKVITCNLTKIYRILRILKLHAEDSKLKPSRTVYKRWASDKKILLRFSKTGHPMVEELYSTHYVAPPRQKPANAKEITPDPAVEETINPAP